MLSKNPKMDMHGKDSVYYIINSMFIKGPWGGKCDTVEKKTIIILSLRIIQTYVTECIHLVSEGVHSYTAAN